MLAVVLTVVLTLGLSRGAGRGADLVPAAVLTVVLTVCPQPRGAREAGAVLFGSSSPAPRAGPHADT